MTEVVLKAMRKIPIRFFVVDDSGSMKADDGHRLTPTVGGGAKLTACSRWSELTDALRFHAQLSELSKAPSEFRWVKHFNIITN